MERSVSDAPGIAYSSRIVNCLLGLPIGSTDMPPKPRPGEIVTYYGGWSLKDLRLCRAGLASMSLYDWYDKYNWKPEPAGYYRLLLPVPCSLGITWNEQLIHLRTIDETWKPAPVYVAATAILVHLMETGNDLLQGAWCRCAEALPAESRVLLAVRGGRVEVDAYWDDGRYGRVCLSACQKC